MTKGKPATEHVEGHLWKINYYPQATATQKPSDLQIIRNYENAVRSHRRDRRLERQGEGDLQDPQGRQ